MAWSRTRVSPALSSTWCPPAPRRPPERLSPGLPAAGTVLAGGTANRGRVLRVGDTVVRPAAPCREATHALLAHLHAAGFDGAPSVLSVSAGTETLTYLPGTPAVPPLAPEFLTDDALVSVAALLRGYHRAAASFDPSGYRWPRPAVPVSFRTGLISHNDVYPANLVFAGGRAAALIDFDLAGPGSAAWDFAAAARTWVPLAPDSDIGDSRAGRVLERFRLLLDASGLPLAERRAVAEAIVPNHDWTYAIVTGAATAGHAAFASYWRQVAAPAARARSWCVRHQRDLRRAAQS